ncbi:helix-turn-helix domain-containing protein [Bacillus solitudinis]|uniref:helix-turn-helix domain-containing protein n=1 Tax=Bacillus solitudinis TaxID=2014074 RepID=UPI0012FDE6CC|nr:helix-turn-helix domain-containing protein [Bacillus solitudinis]
MKINQKLKSSKIILHFLIPYIIIMLVTHSVGLYTSYKTLEIMKSEVVSINISSLNQTKDILERRLHEVDLIIRQLLNTPRVNNYQSVTQPFKGLSTYRTMELIEELFDYKESNNFIFDYYLYYKNSDLVVSANTTYRMSSFYSSMYNYEELDMNGWRKFLTENYHFKEILPSQTMKIQNQTKSLITYVQSLGLPFSSHGAIVILLNNDEIHKMLGRHSKSDEGWAYILNADGEIITSVSWTGEEIIPINIPENNEGMLEKKINSKDMIITYTKSSDNGWVYVMAKPTSTVMSIVNTIQKTAVITLILSLFMGVIIALFMAKRNSKPLNSILRKVTESFDGDTMETKDAYRLIEGTIARLASDNDELEKKVKDQIPILRLTFFEQLLKGEFTTEQDMKRLLVHTGVSITGNYYCVAIFHLKDFKNNEKDELLQLDKARVLAKELILNLTHENCHVHNLEEDQIALLYTCNLKDENLCRTKLTTIINQVGDVLSNQLLIQSTIAVGSLYENISGVPRSFEEAKKALSTSSFQNKKAMIWYENLPKWNYSFHYPFEVESRLINFVKAGDEKETGLLLNQLYEENFIKKQLSFPLSQLFMYELMGTLSKLAEHVNKSEENRDNYLAVLLTQMELKKDLQKTYKIIENVFYDLCNDINERKKSRNVELKDNIKEYIQANFSDSDLCLAKTAEIFNMSEVYLSQFFKEQNGENFSDYLEKLRMSHACEYLQNSTMSINEITSKTGYNTANTFGRAFKRIHGVSASAFRKLKKES